MNKEEWCTIANGYVNSVKRDADIYDTLKEFSIYVDDENNPLVIAVENYIYMCGVDNICQDLCDLAFDDKVEYTNPNVTATTVEEIWDIYFKE